MRADPYSHAVNTANVWLADIADALDTDDRRLTHRATRAWLHCVRDRLIPEAAVKFGTQLPLLMRGTFYEGWEPTRTPADYADEGFMQRFATEAGIDPADAPVAAAGITRVLDHRMSAGQMHDMLAELPTELRETLATAIPHVRRPAVAADETELRQLREQVTKLTGAVRTLARSLEKAHLTGIESAEVAHAARLADEILIGVAG